MLIFPCLLIVTASQREDEVYRIIWINNSGTYLFKIKIVVIAPFLLNLNFLNLKTQHIRCIKNNNKHIAKIEKPSEQY